METLRFITCGSVDDGKSTLIGRLLYESKSIFDDQLAALVKDSAQYGTQGTQMDSGRLPNFGNIGCKPTAAVHFAPSS
ncbi:MAG: hypothetical protein K9K38_19140 [Rhodoferax sp.]|nr:hypothetical protein [Rhodoferax sp.]